MSPYFSVCNVGNVSAINLECPANLGQRPAIVPKYFYRLHQISVVFSHWISAAAKWGMFHVLRVRDQLKIAKPVIGGVPVDVIDFKLAVRDDSVKTLPNESMCHHAFTKFGAASVNRIECKESVSVAHDWSLYRAPVIKQPITFRAMSGPSPVKISVRVTGVSRMKRVFNDVF